MPKGVLRSGDNETAQSTKIRQIKHVYARLMIFLFGIVSLTKKQLLSVLVYGSVDTAIG